MSTQSIPQLWRMFLFFSLGYLGWLMHIEAISFDLYLWIRDSIYFEPMRYLETGEGWEHWLYCDWIVWSEGG